MERQILDVDGARPEESLIKAFVHPDRQARLLALLASPRRRRKLRAELAHFRALDPRYASRVPVHHQSASGIAELLRQRGSPDTCYVLSEDVSIDAKVLPLGATLEAVVGMGMGTFISCLPGRLAYFEGEDPGERYVLFRDLWLRDAPVAGDEPAGSGLGSMEDASALGRTPFWPYDRAGTCMHYLWVVAVGLFAGGLVLVFRLKVGLTNGWSWQAVEPGVKALARALVVKADRRWQGLQLIRSGVSRQNYYFDSELWQPVIRLLGFRPETSL